MKKLFVVFAFLILAAFGVYAAPGDVAGEIYSTDILAYVNGSPINSYNIGGQTVILAEDLCNNDTGVHYGFDCVYDNQTRTLTLTSLFNKGNADITVSRGKVGEIVGTVYETDIRVIFNSHEVKGYNIGGQTAICIEDLGAHEKNEPGVGYGYSKYLCNAVWDGANREITLNTYLQDTNYFGNYPRRKLDIKVTDNIISCSFDQLGSYSGSVSYEFSDEFKSNLWKITPVYFGNTVVGQVVMLPGGMAAFKMNNFEMHQKTSGLEKVLSYGEAVAYINDNFEVVEKRENADATIYLAKKDGYTYLLFAMADDGLVCDSKYDSSYSVVEFVENDEGQLCLNLRSDLFSGIIPISTAGYTFDDNAENYISGALPENKRISSRTGVAKLTVNDSDYIMPALVIDNNIYLDAHEAAAAFGAEYNMYGGVVYISIPVKSFAANVMVDSSSVKIPDSVSVFSADTAYVNGKPVKLVENAYYFGKSVYIPFNFLTGIFK